MKAATLFEPYLDRLDVPDRLDAIQNLAHVFGSLHRWEKVDALAKELHRIARIHYEQQLDQKGNYTRPKHPVYFYILYSYLMRSVVYEEVGDFEKALHFVTLYEDGSWIQDRSGDAEQIIKQFQQWGKANKLLYRLLSGDVEVLPMYLELVSSNEKELPTALSKIVQAANRHMFNIDSILDRFSSYLPYKSNQEYDKYIMAEQNAHFLIQLGIYYLHNNRAGGIDWLLQGLDLSVKINSDKNIIRCMTLYELYRDLSTPEEASRYKILVREVQKRNETKVNLSGSLV
ncbi:hypothetical protein M4D52_14920 [Paenibacillus lactis]|uniref:hypothetical protein n=1 Tax=Paenibacillus lactis TaxID=228574 RepID=UPI00203A7794|nr:hypothetical protein [Paenibacillus lactis]MCM3494729.1 hypothetical protein [Paenibacillus lactis]